MLIIVIYFSDITSSSTEGLEYMDIERMNTGKAKLETSTDKVETTESQISGMIMINQLLRYQISFTILYYNQLVA